MADLAFGRVTIVGVGLIGGSLGLALRAGNLAHVVGVGRSQEALQTAKHLGAIDTFETDLQTGVAEADLVVLATPVPHVLETLSILGPFVGPHTTITDVGSTKGEVARAGDIHLPGRFVGGHPMAGGEKSGVEAAHTDLFQGAAWAVTPTNCTTPSALQTVRDLALSVGARVVELAPDDHDSAVAVTSHLPHVLAYALAAVGSAYAAQNPALYDLVAGSWASGTRVAQSSPELWQGIALSNRAALLQTLRDCQEELATVAEALANEDAEAVLQAFRRGHLAKLKETRSRE